MKTKQASHLFHEGTYFRSYEYFGAHFNEKGVCFRVYAPYAQGISVVGDFNDWDPEANPMKLLKNTGGIWEITIPDLQPGTLYKYCIIQCDGEIAYKADPYAFYAEHNPGTASILYALDGYKWKDAKWIEKRQKQQPLNGPMNIYELHLGSWRRHADGTVLSYTELADSLVSYLKEMHYTHVEFMPVMEHPFDGSWGYQLTGYYAATSRYGEPKELMFLIDALHKAGIGVILDWVPGHFCKDAHGLYKFDGTNLYEALEHPHWGTMEFAFEKPEVLSFLISNALFWFDYYHIDGLRIDGVASMIYLNYGYDDEWRKNKYGGNDSLEAVEFLRRLNSAVFKSYPFAIMAAEESTAYPKVSWPVDEGGLGFNMKWDMGWMHDTLAYMETDPYCRSQFHSRLTFSMAYAFSENFILPLSHDEVVHGKKSIIDKMFGDYAMKFDQMRLLYAYMTFHSGKKLTFMGNEFAPFTEWRYYEELEWFMLEYDKHRDMQNYIRSLNKFYLKEKALWEKDHGWDGFEWIDADNAGQSILIFRRMGENPEDDLVILINFCPIDYTDYRIGVPEDTTYRLVFNSDDSSFGGNGQTVKKSAKAQKIPYHNQPYSITLNVPASTALVLKGVVHRSKNKNTKSKKNVRTVSKNSKKTAVVTSQTEKPALIKETPKSVTTVKKAEKPAVKDTSPKPVATVKEKETAIVKQNKK